MNAVNKLSGANGYKKSQEPGARLMISLSFRRPPVRIHEVLQDGKALLLIIALLTLTGCETLQTPHQRQATARQQASVRYTEERVQRLQGQVESIEMENARLMQEMQQLRQDVGSMSSQMAQLSSSMGSLESKQAREMNELIRRVESLLKKSMAARPAPTPSRGAGREHVVEAGHTLSAIAQAYGTSIKAIKDANNLKSDNIYVGQKLFIPE